MHSRAAWVAVTLVAVFLADQVSKAAIVASIQEPAPYQVRTFFYLTHERNAGMIGGLFAGNRFAVLAGALVAMSALLYVFRHLSPGSRTQTIAYGAVAGGGVGNLVDRLVRGDVVDFLQVHFYFVPFDFPWKFWPAFNLADMAICCGVAVLFFSWLRPDAKKETDVPNVA